MVKKKSRLPQLNWENRGVSRLGVMLTSVAAAASASTMPCPSILVGEPASVPLFRMMFWIVARDSLGLMERSMPAKALM